jgi:hypothetical protein
MARGTTVCALLVSFEVAIELVAREAMAGE